VAAAAVILSTLILSQGIEFREQIPIKKPFSTFPMQIGQWQGTRQVMEQKFIDTLDFSDYLLTQYVNPKGEVVNFYVAYYETQRKGESIHSPTTCLTGGGWIFKDREVITVNIPGRAPFRIKRAVLEQPGSRQLAYYWFPMRGRDLTSAYEMKLYNFIDAMLKHRTDGALVRIMTPLGPDESPQDGDARLQEFMKDVLPILDQYLPE
jgi:EpsI family protein